MITRPVILAFFCCALAAAQANSVTVTVSRNTNLQSDQIVFNLSVTSPVTTTRDAVQAALQNSGVTSAAFSGISSLQNSARNGQPAQVALQWLFQVPVPFANLKQTVATLTAAQAAIAANQSGLTLSFAVGGTQVSPQLLQSQSCAAGDLLSDARAKAQLLATAAGQPLGGVLSISASSVVTDPGSGILPAPTYLPVCTLTVRYALGTAAQDLGVISIAASRPSSTQPDQVIVYVSVDAAASASLDDVLAGLASAGITASDLTGVYTNSPDQTQWSFNHPVAFSQLGSTLAALAAFLQKSPNSLSYAVQGTSTSAALTSSQTCAWSPLVSDARTQALKLAQAAGLTLGPVVSESDAGAPIALAGFLSGSFSAVYDPYIPYPGNIIPASFRLGILQSPYTAPVPSCAMNVQFQLQH